MSLSRAGGGSGHRVHFTLEGTPVKLCWGLFVTQYLDGGWLGRSPWGTISGVTQYDFNTYNHITNGGITYDAAGNVTYDGFHSYTYDAENRMITVDGGPQTYFYDAFGRQTQTIYGGNTYSRIFGLNGRTEVQFQGNTWMLSELYIGSTGDYLGNYSNNTTYFAHSDRVGTRRMYTGPTGGSPVETCTSLPFGDGTSCSGSGPASITAYTGQDWDPATNLIRFPMRNYQTVEGRWTTPDPAGMAAADPTNPQSWNRYAYALNNPLSNIDPTGLDCAYLNDRGDDIESIDQSSDAGECGSNGGYWVDGGLANYQINSEQGSVQLWGATSTGLSVYGNTYAQYQDTTATVGVFDNTFLNPFQHVGLSIGGGPFFGQNPRSDLRFLGHFLFGSPNSPGVPGIIKVQDPSTMTHSTSFPVTGMQATMIQNEINQSMQNPPPYDVYGPSPSCDCAFWIQNVLGGAGINTGGPTIYPMDLLWQIDVATGQVVTPIPGGPYQ